MNYRAASHLFTLIRVLDQTEGDVLELGAGRYSTPVLTWLCSLLGKKFVSYETNPKWVMPGVTLISSWRDFAFLSQHWGVVFIDMAPASVRAETALNFKDNADFIVLHDSEPEHDNEYGYSKIYSQFKYVCHDNKHYPHTTTVSNFYPIIWHPTKP